MISQSYVVQSKSESGTPGVVNLSLRVPTPGGGQPGPMAYGGGSFTVSVPAAAARDLEPGDAVTMTIEPSAV